MWTYDIKPNQNNTHLTLLLPLVDTSKAGEGDLLVEVKCQGRLLITKEMTMTQHNRRFTFVPMLADVHEVTVMFNKDHVPGKYYPIL